MFDPERAARLKKHIAEMEKAKNKRIAQLKLALRLAVVVVESSRGNCRCGWIENCLTCRWKEQVAKMLEAKDD